MTGLGRVVLMGAGLALTACGQPNPRILESKEVAQRGAVAADRMPESVKIRGLIAAVRRSELTFVHDDIERPGAAAADKLQLLLDRDVEGCGTAREFIRKIGAPKREGDEQDYVILGPESTMPADEWFGRQLAKLEGVEYKGRIDPEVAAEEAVRTVRRLEIIDAIKIVEASEKEGLIFVVPPRRQLPKAKSGGLSLPNMPKLPKSRKKPKAKEYSGRQFASMLRKKWEFLGADIDDLDMFIEEIASDSFATLEPYVVLHPDGEREEFQGWLQARLEEKRQKMARAQGGAP